MLEVKYVKMPISIEEKKEYNRHGFRVVDERFAPEGHEPEQQKEKAPRAKSAKAKSGE